MKLRDLLQEMDRLDAESDRIDALYDAKPEDAEMKKWDDNSWTARHSGTSRHIALTKKGLRAFYKAMF